MKIKLTLIVIIVSFFCFAAIAQTSIVVAGNEARNSTINMSYTVGQAFVSNSPYILTGGDILSTLIGDNGWPLGNKDELQISDAIKISLYPNPSNGIFYLELKNLDNLKSWSYQVININGAKMLNNLITEQKTLIDISHLSKGVYLLIVSYKNNTQKILKVILS